MEKVSKIVAAAVLLAGSGAVAAAQRPAASASRTAAAAPAPARLGGKPNINGIWQTMNTANWNVEPHDSAEAPAAPEKLGAIGAIRAGLGVTEGYQKLPYKPEAIAQRDANRKGAPMVDPEAACYLPGIPRATYMGYPFQIVQADNGDMIMVYEYAAANRVIHMGPVGVPPIDTWMGTSYGQWDGDTLKVTTLASNPGDVILPGGETKPGVTWLDRSGNYITGTATVVERFTPIDSSHMRYQVAVDDPSVYTKPWRMEMVLYKDITPDAQLLEFRCVPYADKLLYGDLLADKDKYPKK